MSANGPLGVFLNGQRWSGVLTETPAVGSTEDWWLVNPTADTHPIHTHLTQFQVLYRIPFDFVKYQQDWETLNGMAPVPLDYVPQELDVTPYLTGAQNRQQQMSTHGKTQSKHHPAMLQ